VRPLSEELVDRSDAIGPDHVGLRVVSVNIESPARDRLCPSAARQQCGFGDIITHVNGERVRTTEEFDAALAGVEAGAIVSLRVFNPDAGAGQGLSRVVRVRVQ
ncbi:MAG: PDZ domain-containing protein, partial [Gemmatimonadales bacterium]